jgi:hypothetical protein
MKELVNNLQKEKLECGRRGFLKAAGLVGAGTAIGGLKEDSALGQEAEPIAKKMPTVPFGPHRISRLVLGSNPIRGTTHTLPRQMNLALQEFYTVHRAVQLLRRCEQVGINYFQTEPHPVVTEALKRYRDMGGKLQFMATVTGAMKRDPQPTEDLFAAGPTSTNIMGETVDGAYRRGRMEEIHDMLKGLHDRGLFAGIGSHSPEVVEYIEDKGWETDFYVLCAYNLRRSQEEWQRLLGEDLPTGEIYLSGDPARACATVRQIDKPCILFKILAAGRLIGRGREEKAFQFILDNIKPTDAVDVGMSIMVADEPKLNAELTVKYGYTS